MINSCGNPTPISPANFFRRGIKDGYGTELHSVIIIFIICILGATSVHAIPITFKESPVPGGIIKIPLEISTRKARPTVLYLNKKTLVIADQNSQWSTIVGIPLNAKLGKNTIDIETSEAKYKKTFIVKKKNYPLEKLNIPSKPPKDTSLEQINHRITTEYQEILDIYNHWGNTEIRSFTLAKPVSGRISSIFGIARIINGIPKNPHSGLDIAAPKGAYVKAAKDGVIIRTGNYFYSGKTVFIDHGQGFITSYSHLHNISAKVNSRVKQGDIIGTIGNTGRATGPHLHWAVSLNGVRIDPQLFL